MSPLNIQAVSSVGQIEPLQQSCSHSSFFDHSCSQCSLAGSSCSSSASRNSVSSPSSLGELRLGDHTNVPRGRPYFNTMMGRRHIRPPVATSPSPRDSEVIRKGSLYLQLRSKGVTEEVAFNRQRMYNRLNAIVNTCNDKDF